MPSEKFRSKKYSVLDYFGIMLVAPDVIGGGKMDIHSSKKVGNGEQMNYHGHLYRSRYQHVELHS